MNTVFEFAFISLYLSISSPQKKLEIVHCTYLVVSGYNFPNVLFFCLKIFLCLQRNCPSVSPSFLLCVRCISPIFFEVGIPNFVCGCIIGWRSAEYHFRVSETYTSGLVFRIIVSGAYLLYYLRQESQIWCVHASWAYHYWLIVTMTLTSDLVSRNCIEPGAYLYILWDRNFKFGV